MIKVDKTFFSVIEALNYYYTSAVSDIKMHNILFYILKLNVIKQRTAFFFKSSMHKHLYQNEKYHNYICAIKCLNSIRVKILNT